MRSVSTGIFSVLSSLIAVGYAATSGSEAVGISCLLFQDLSFYDVRSLANKEADYQLKPEGSTSQYVFNLCSQTKTSCSNEPDKMIFAYKKNEDGTCQELTDGSITPAKIIPGEKSDYLQIAYSP